MRPGLILTDIDETVLQFADPFQDWAETVGYKTNGRLMENYRIEHHFGVDSDHADRMMTEFGKTDIMLAQPAWPDALTVLPRLYKAGWRFVGITACGTDTRFANQRIKTIEDTFGFAFDDMHFVEHHCTKHDVLKSYPASIWVEDNYAHAVNGAELNHFSFLIDRPYNIHEPEVDGVVRVRNWFEIEETISI